MRRALTFALCGLLLAGCTAITRHDPSPQNANPNALAPSPVQVVGRVIAVDLSAMNVIIDVSPYAVLPLDFEKRTLITRTDDLRATAKLQASPYLRGHTLGARLIAGRPVVGDEVVIPPAMP